ncbi:MAG: CHAD domain-containing protein [Dongiaceae bacterium]
MAHEIELKLRIAPADAARLRRDGVLTKIAGGRGATAELSSVYFDTPDLALHRSRMALRVRRIGQRRVQTLKRATEGPHGAQSYHELEREIAGARPRLELIDDPAVRRKLMAPRISGRLKPVFRTKFVRTTWLASYRGAQIEVALDMGHVGAGHRRVRISELELELKSGPARRLFEMAMELVQGMPLSIEHQTKADRGFQLARAKEPSPARAEALALSDGMTAAAAFAAIARNCVDQLRQNEIVVRQGSDPEGAHQMRVGLRRLRALIGAYRKQIPPNMLAFLATELDWLQQELGAARDWDVFIGETLRPLRDRMPDEEALALLLTASDACRARGYDAVRAMLEQRRYAVLQLRLYGWLAGGGWARPRDEASDPRRRSVGAFAATVLSKRHKRLRRLGGKHTDLPEDDLHRLRLQAKKLRYVAEFFRDLHGGKAARRFIDAVSKIQNQLGSLNDALVSRRLLAQLDHDLAAAGHADLADRGIAIVHGWQAARIDHDLRELSRIWKEFRELRPFWEREK